ncbi:putative permease [Thermoplasmatales archaeon]|nr:putative permease [Thermoplasmatales archaeon]
MSSSRHLIERTLIVEQRYLGMRNSVQFQNKINRLNYGPKKYFDRMIFLNYGFTAVMLIIFSIVMVFPALFSTSPETAVADVGFVLFAYTLSMSIYNSFIFFNTIGNHRLVEPLGVLPVKNGDDILFMSWLKYNGSSSIFIVVPVLVLYAIKFSSYETLFMGSIWLLSIIILGYSVGAIIYMSVRKRISGDRSPIMSSIKGALRMMVIIGIFAMFEIMIYFPGVLINYIPRAAGLPGMLVPLLNVTTVVFQASPVNLNFISDIGVTTFYLAVFLVAFSLIKSRIFTVLSNSPDSIPGNRQLPVNLRVYGFFYSLFMKDIRGILRKSQNIILIFLPAIFVLPTILPLLVFGTARNTDVSSLYYSLLSIVIISSTFYSIVLMASEGNGIEVINSLPLSNSDQIISKSVVGIFLFVLIVSPLTILITALNGMGVIVTFFLLFNIIVAYSYTSLFNLKWLRGKISDGTRTINFYSFGGNIVYVLLFIYSLSLIALSAMAGNFATFAVFHSFYTNSNSFIYFESIFNILIFLGIFWSVVSAR